MTWTVNSTNVLRDIRRNADNLSTDDVYSFIEQATPMNAEICHRLWLDLVTTGRATLGVYQFSGTATD
jgi:hypothetical protein